LKKLAYCLGTAPPTGSAATSYWNAMWRWYLTGGLDHVAAFLVTRDLALFDPKASPPKTEAFWTIVDTHRSPEDSELADALDTLGKEIPGSSEREWPDAVPESPMRRARPAVVSDVDHRPQKPPRDPAPDGEVRGYVPVRHPDRKDGDWIVGRNRVVIYAKDSLSIAERIRAAHGLTLRAGAY
jgi:hypothetical protein